MQAQLKKKTEIKIYILYVMKNIGYPCTFTRLNDTITADGPVDYFNFAECFSELLDTGNVQSSTLDGEECFVITEQGIHVADNLLDMLIPSVQRTALAAATRLTSFDKRGASISHRYEKCHEGGYRIHFCVTERGVDIFALSVKLENEEQVKRMEHNLSKNTDGIYKSILALLSGQADYVIQ